MAWGRLDDRLDDHPKFTELSLAAVGLWTICMPRSLRRSDASVTRGHAKRFAGEQIEAITGELVAVGLWEPTEDGWIYHDFSDYLPPESMEDRQRQAGKKSAEVRRARYGSAQPSRTLPEPVREPVREKAPEHTPNRPNPEPEPEPVNALRVSTIPSERYARELDENPFGEPDGPVLAESPYAAEYRSAKAAIGVAIVSVSSEAAIDAAARELVDHGASSSDVLEAVRRTAWNPRAAPARLDIELERLQTERGAPRPEPRNDWELANRQISERALAARLRREQEAPIAIDVPF